jgi:hypothetical protein
MSDDFMANGREQPDMPDNSDLDTLFNR